MIEKALAKFKKIWAAMSHSLRNILVFWFLLLSIVPFVAVSWYGYAQTLKSVNEMQRNKLSDNSALDVATLNSQFYEAVRDLNSWSDLILPRSLLSVLSEQYGQSGKSIGEFTHSTAYQKLLGQQPSRLEKLAKQFEYVYDLFLIDLQGNILYTVKQEADFGTNLQRGPYANTRFAQAYRESLSDGKAHFSDIESYGASKGIVTGFITQPMHDDTGKIIGVMGLQLNMDVLFASLKGKAEGAQQYLVGSDGLLRTPIDDRSEVLKRRISTEVFWDWYNEHGIGKKNQDTMTEVAHVYAGPNGKEVLGEHRSINLLGVRWAHISEMDQSVVTAVPQRLFTAILIFALITLGSVLIASFIIARRIVKPIEALSIASKQYMGGIKGIQVALDTSNEIGAFGSVFNALIHKQEADASKLDQLAQKTQKTLEELKEQKYALDAHSIVAITDVKGNITFVNTKFEEITGYTQEELIGQNHRLLNSRLHSSEFWKEMYHTVSHGNIWNAEVRNITKFGSYYWVDTTIVPFMDEAGKPESYIAIRTDITERKKAQDALDAALSLQKAIFDNAGVSIITTDLEGMITGFNAAAEAMLGYTAEEIVGKQTPAIFHKVEEVVRRANEFSQQLGENVEPGFAVFTIKAQRNLPNAHEWSYVRKDASELAVYLSVTQLHEADGKTAGYMGIASDISLFKEAEKQMLIAKEAAESSVRVKSEFLATMSHEIRTPMNGVLGMLGLLGHSKLDAQQSHQLQVAANSANSLLGLINDILDFSKVEAGKMELELIEFNLRDELGEFVEAIAFRAQEKRVEVILDTVGLKRTAIITDPGRLRQILNNIVGNSIKFTHRGEILITVSVDEVDEQHGRLHIDVRDSGIGIAADKIGSLFESFSQADNSTTRKYGGSGLGLAIVKKLCELMDGTISVTSVEHEGSTFHIDLGIGLGATSAVCVPSIPVSGKSVLVVDDNETNRNVVRAQMEQWGMIVSEAEDPIIAYDQCRIRISQGHIPPYDVALLDMQMPNMDGADLGEELRNIPQCDEMKMIMMTSLGSRSDAKRFAEIGFDAFFAKPTTTKDLLNALKVLFGGGAALEDANPLVTKDYLGTLHEEYSQIQWPAATRILLVEDNPTNQIVAQGMLDTIGLEADIANNGLEALESMKVALDTAPYTLILMDCQMPEMDGYTASSAIREGRAGEAYNEVPIIAMTANAMAGDREKCLISGMSDYISKPINAQLLKEVLIKWLNGELVAASPSGSFDETVHLPQDERSGFQVWDEAEALSRLGGKKELLNKIMHSFLAERSRMMDALNEAIAHDDFANAQLHAHSIKGSAGNVSAQRLQAVAKMMEEAAKNGQISVLKEGYGPLDQAMKEVCDVFEKELSREVKPLVRKKRYDPLKMAIQLQKLKKEIEMGTFIDTDVFDLFGEYADEVFNTNMSTLKGHIDRFDTNKALALLERIMAGLE